MTARKPPSLKLLAGTYRFDRSAPGPALPALDTVPSPPAWLTDLESLREWRRLAPVLVANRLLSTGNIGAFGQYCALHGHLIGAWQSDVAPTAALLSAYRSLTVSLGLAHLPEPTLAGKPNRFSANHSRAFKGGR